MLVSAIHLKQNGYWLKRIIKIISKLTSLTLKGFLTVLVGEFIIFSIKCPSVRPVAHSQILPTCHSAKKKQSTVTIKLGSEPN